MTETGTLTLTDFLLARIAEVEAANPLTKVSVGYEAGGHWHHFLSRDAAARAAQHMTRGPVVMQEVPRDGEALANAQAWRTECEAKRRIIAELDHWHDPSESRLLSLLALPYADHPDYRAEWRP